MGKSLYGAIANMLDYDIVVTPVAITQWYKPSYPHLVVD